LARLGGCGFEPAATPGIPSAPGGETRSGAAGASESSLGLIPRRNHGRSLSEVDDVEGGSDRRARIDHDREALRAALERDSEQPMERGAVEEEEAAEVDDDRPSRCGRLDLRDEVVGIRQVELAREGDERDVGIACLLVLQLERAHDGAKDTTPGRLELTRRREASVMAVDFAHPIERALARLFDEHGIAWQYEPHTFVLERDETGNVREGFTPDFFLPEVGVYIECTVMRQSLTRRKRRKARKTRERTGTIVEIAFRRDFDRLASRWDIPALARATDAGVDVCGCFGVSTRGYRRGDD
jgi:hypothetical protein